MYIKSMKSPSKATGLWFENTNDSMHRRRALRGLTPISVCFCGVIVPIWGVFSSSSLLFGVKKWVLRILPGVRLALLSLLGGKVS